MFVKQIILKITDNPINKKFFIFSGVSFFAIQSLISIIYYSVNFPLVDDWPVVYLSIHYLQNDPVWLELLFSHDNEHYLYTYRIIMMLGLLINSFNVQQFMFVNWTFLTISIGIFYLILKKTDKRLVWLIIPISAFIFNPKMVSVNFISSWGLVWIGTFFFLVTIVGILNKEKLSKYWFILAVCLSTIATFSSLLGLLSWVSGTLILIQKYKENRNYLLLWVGISIIVFSLYVLNMEFEPRENSMISAISTAGFSWGLKYITTPFSFGFLDLRVLVGAISLISLLFVSTYFLKKGASKSYPWIVFGIIGIFSTIVITGGRFELRTPFENYLIPMSLFIHISLLVLVTFLFLESKKFKKKKKILSKIFFIVFILGQFVFFSSAYFVGYEYVSEWKNEKSYWLTCFDLPSNLDVCNYWHPFGNPYESGKSGIGQEFQIYDILIEKKLSIFSDEDFFLNQEQNQIDLDIKWNDFKEGTGMGEIEKIDGINISNTTMNLKEPYVSISGWLIGNDNKIDEMYLLIDGKSFLKNTNFESRGDIIEKFDLNSTDNIGWNLSFWTAFLEDGCHNLTIGGIYDNRKFILEEEIEICKN